MKVRAITVGTHVQIEIKLGPKWHNFGFMNYKERDELSGIIKGAAAAVRDGVSYNLSSKDIQEDENENQRQTNYHPQQ